MILVGLTDTQRSTARLAAALAALTLATAHAAAPEEAPAEPTRPASAPEAVVLEEVVVAGQRSSLTLPLAVLEDVLAAFRKHRPADSAAQLYLTVRPKKGRVASTTALEAILRPADPEATEVQVPADSMGRLRVEDLEAMSQGGTLAFNRSAQSAEIRLQVRTAPESETDIRLGDLRLECRVNLALAWRQLPLLARMAFSAVDACGSPQVGFSFPRRAGSGPTVLVEGERTLRLDRDDRDTGVTVPLHDRGWGDAARLLFGAQRAPAAPS